MFVRGTIGGYNMIWIVLGMSLILVGFIGIYYLIFKFDRKKLDVNYIDTPSFDGIFSILLFFIVIILIALFHEKLPNWFIRSVLLIVCLLPILLGVFLIIDEISGITDAIS